MDVIADELQKNGVHIDVETLSEHIHYILENYRDTYNESVNRLSSEELLLNVFYEMDVNTVGRAMAYLTLVYRMNPTESTTRNAVRLVVPVMMHAGRVEGSFIRKMCLGAVQSVLNLWDLMK